MWFKSEPSAIATTTGKINKVRPLFHVRIRNDTSRKEREEGGERQADRQTDRQTKEDRQTERDKERKRETKGDRERRRQIQREIKTDRNRDGRWIEALALRSCKLGVKAGQKSECGRTTSQILTPQTLLAHFRGLLEVSRFVFL